MSQIALESLNVISMTAGVRLETTNVLFIHSIFVEELCTRTI